MADNLEVEKIDIKLGRNKENALCFYRARYLHANDCLKRRIRYIKEQKFPSLFLRYEKRSGWASIATDSSKDTIPNDNNGVKK